MRYNLSEIKAVIEDRRSVQPENFSSRKVHREIVMELLDAATGRVLPGYAAVDCVPLVGDGVAQVVQWKNSAGLRAVPGDFRIRFHLQGAGGGPKFHSFFFQ